MKFLHPFILSLVASLIYLIMLVLSMLYPSTPRPFGKRDYTNLFLSFRVYCVIFLFFFDIMSA